MSCTPLPPTRRRIVGVQAVESALLNGTRLALVLVRRGCTDNGVDRIREIAAGQGTVLWEGGDGDMRRVGPTGGPPVDAIGLMGPEPAGSLAELMGRGGVVWHLDRAAYPSNVGFTIRTAEVSGADGVIVNAPTFNREDRSRVSHVTMGADRVLPVVWRGTDEVVAAARSAGKRIIAIEDVGEKAHYDIDLTGSILLIVGNERHGIDPSVLETCDAVARIPMLGFVPSYSLQAAVSMIAGERLRQLARPSNHK